MSTLEYGKMRKINKSDFLSCLKESFTSSLSSPEITAKVIDGATAVRSLKPVVSKTLGEYAKINYQIQ